MIKEEAVKIAGELEEIGYDTLVYPDEYQSGWGIEVVGKKEVGVKKKHAKWTDKPA